MVLRGDDPATGHDDVAGALLAERLDELGHEDVGFGSVPMNKHLTCAVHGTMPLVLAVGGMRDALVMLEQVTSYGGATVTAETVLDMLGLADRTMLESFLQAIEAHDQPMVMDIVDQLIDRGKDLEIFLSDIIAVLRDRLRKPSPQFALDIQVTQRLLAIKADLFRSLDRRIRLEIGVLALMDSLFGEAPAATVTPSTPEPESTTGSRKPVRWNSRYSTSAAGGSGCATRWDRGDRWRGMAAPMAKRAGMPTDLASEMKYAWKSVQLPVLALQA